MTERFYKLISPLTRVYQEKDLYKEKKAAYTILFLFLIVFYSMLTFIITLTYNEDILRSVFEFSVWIILVPVILMLIRFGKLNAAINIFMALGILKGITLFDSPMGVQLFIQMSLVSLTLAAVAVKKYQLYIGSFTAYILFIIKAFYKLNSEVYTSPDLIINYRLSVFVTFLMYLVTILYLNRIVDREIEKARKMKNLMNTDALTQLPNRFAFNRFVSSMDSKSSYYIMILDLDHFKLVNDTYGHMIGDNVLVQIAEILKNNLRQSDKLFRIGGEEFCIILENVSKENGFTIAKELCRMIGSSALSIAEFVTVSVGTSYIKKEWQAKQFDSYFAHADKALYKAKEKGRNQVVEL